MTPFGKDVQKLEVVGADFLPDGNQLLFVVADAESNIHILQYDPERKSQCPFTNCPEIQSASFENYMHTDVSLIELQIQNPWPANDSSVARSFSPGTRFAPLPSFREPAFLLPSPSRPPQTPTPPTPRNRNTYASSPL